MRPLVVCAFTGCPGIWLDEEDGSVVVQGIVIGLVNDQGEMAPVTWPFEGVEGRVRIPVGVLRQAVLHEALGYRVRHGEETLVLAPEDVDVIFQVDEQ